MDLLDEAMRHHQQLALNVDIGKIACVLSEKSEEQTKNFIERTMNS